MVTAVALTLRETGSAMSALYHRTSSCTLRQDIGDDCVKSVIDTIHSQWMRIVLKSECIMKCIDSRHRLIFAVKCFCLKEKPHICRVLKTHPLDIVLRSTFLNVTN